MTGPLADPAAERSVLLRWPGKDRLNFQRYFLPSELMSGLRGADRYPTLIRKFEPQPVKIFLQDGSNDLNIYAGDWWMANQTMERALIFSGYSGKSCLG